MYKMYMARPQGPAMAPLDKNDPLYHLQEFIAHALVSGHSGEEIRQKLLSVGWDEVIVDQELEKVMLAQMDAGVFVRS